MSGLQAFVDDLTKRVIEGPSHIATTADYNAWLWGLVPAKRQELYEVKETKIIELEDGMYFEFVDYNAGVFAAWKRHCQEQGWEDQAFKEAGRRAREDLIRSIDREIELAEEDSAEAS